MTARASWTAAVALATVALATGCSSNDKAHRPAHRKGPAPTVGSSMNDDPVPPPMPPAPPPPPPRVAAPAPPPPPRKPAPPPPPPRPVAERKPKQKSGTPCDDAGGKGPYYDVWGVESSDVLNVRTEPNAGASVVGELPPDTTGVTLLGDTSGSWRKIACGKVRGWVNGKFLSRAKN